MRKKVWKAVLELMPERQDRYALYRCQCDCGREVMVNSKRLKRGSVQGCPDCWESRSKQPMDLTGRRFGSLVVVALADERKSNRRTWHCQCDCGQFRDVTTHELQVGHAVSCGCKNRKNFPYRDLTGHQIGWLKVLEMTDQRTEKGSILWKCRCVCGTEKLYSEDTLVHGGVISCGCYREKEIPKLLSEALHHVDGTCIEFLQRRKRSDNTSGHTGVHILKNGKFRAYITFKKKRYYLGTFDTLQDAIDARKKGEEMHEEFLEQYYEEHPEMVEKKRKIESKCQIILREM